MRRISLFLSTALVSVGAFSALSHSARAEIVLMGNDPAGWVFSVDGFLNAFVTQSGAEKLPVKAGGTYVTPAFSIGSNVGSSSHVTSGFVPESFGFNVKSPDIDGNKLSARLSLQTSINNPGSHAWDSDGAATGATPGLIREAYLTWGGKWGEVQAGKSLGIFGGQAILNDMYIFGVGSGLNSNGQPYNAFNTTTGGIGYGYTYAGWNGNIRYTTPTFLGGAKATIGVFEPNSISSAVVAASGTASSTANTVTASKTRSPRFEGGVNWAGKIGEATLATYLNGTWQTASFAGQAPTLLAGTSFTANGSSVNIYGGELGGKLTYGPVDFVAHVYGGPGMGLSGAQLSFDSLDLTGKANTGYGYYVQAAYNFGQGTSLSGRYGSSYIDQTSYQKKQATNLTYNMTEKDMAGVMLTHVVNKWVRLVGEYDYVTNSWADDASQHEHIGAAGIVVTY
jgi:hypothetical protein